MYKSGNVHACLCDSYAATINAFHVCGCLKSTATILQNYSSFTAIDGHVVLPAAGDSYRE